VGRSLRLGEQITQIFKLKVQGSELQDWVLRTAGQRGGPADLDEHYAPSYFEFSASICSASPGVEFY
jgi:hypothetical protein